MKKLILAVMAIFILPLSISACAVEFGEQLPPEPVPPYGSGYPYPPAPYYPGPAYVAPPPVALGFGFGFGGRGEHFEHGGHFAHAGHSRGHGGGHHG